MCFIVLVDFIHDLLWCWTEPFFVGRPGQAVRSTIEKSGTLSKLCVDPPLAIERWLRLSSNDNRPRWLWPSVYSQYKKNQARKNSHRLTSSNPTSVPLSSRSRFRAALRSFPRPIPTFSQRAMHRSLQPERELCRGARRGQLRSRGGSRRGWSLWGE